MHTYMMTIQSKMYEVMSRTEGTFTPLTVLMFAGGMLYSDSQESGTKSRVYGSDGAKRPKPLKEASVWRRAEDDRGQREQ